MNYEAWKDYMHKVTSEASLEAARNNAHRDWVGRDVTKVRLMIGPNGRVI